MKILCFGEVLWDIIDGQEYLGGAPFNVAAHLAKCGVNSFICARVGDDERGRRVLAEMARLGVDPMFTSIDREHPTGSVTVTLAADGQPSYVIHENVAWDFIELDDALMDAVRELSLQAFCFGTLAQRSETSRRTLHKLLERPKGIPVFFDVNLRQQYYSAEVLRESLAKATILKLNHDEVLVLGKLLFGKTLTDEELSFRVAMDYGTQTVLITMGDKGCAVWHDKLFDIVAGKKVDVVDTVGAGDAFSAGFLLRYCQGVPVIDAVQQANELGAYVASQRGAIPDYSDAIRTRLQSI